MRTHPKAAAESAVRRIATTGTPDTLSRPRQVSELQAGKSGLKAIVVRARTVERSTDFRVDACESIDSAVARASVGQAAEMAGHGGVLDLSASGSVGMAIQGLSR
jgi:hypothetical protein